METNHAVRAAGAHGPANRGFSLTELLIVLAIIGILAGIAMPSYQDYVTKATRNAAKGVVLDLAQMEERYLSNNGLFLAVPAPTAGPPAVCQAAPWLNYSGSDCATRKYDVAVAVDNATMTYTITATPANGFLDATCGTLTMLSNGQKSASTGAACW